MPFHVYILRCEDGTLYVGSTADLRSRLDAHNEGRGGHYTASRRPVTLLYSEIHATRQDTVARERQIKVRQTYVLTASPRLTLERLRHRQGAKLRLSRAVRDRRAKLAQSQAALAKRLHSSQSRVAKIEAADPTVSVDLLLKARFALGATPRDVATAIRTPLSSAA